jgi:sugar fermentation stimulation protein A
MKLFSAIEEGMFISRPNRFMVICTVRNRAMRAYLPNPGRLRELLLPGCRLFLVPKKRKESKLPYMAVAVEKDGALVFLHTHVNNVVARKLIEQQKIPGLEGAEVVRSEVAAGHSRFDFLLRKDGQDLYLEVKSCTLFHGSVSMFPDAVTARGTRHILELSLLTKYDVSAAVLFLVHSPAARFFLPEYHTDLEFSRALLSVRDSIMVRALSVAWRKDLTPGKRIHELTIPWNVIERESQDRGSYLIVLHLKRSRSIAIGGMGNIECPRGFYIYTGSAKKNLSQRIARHRRKAKKHFWHIDYFREHADFCDALPVRTSDELECELAGAVRKISQWEIPGFGSSDCNCASHLFGMHEDPSASGAFIDMLLYFRMGRLEKELICGKMSHSLKRDSAPADS